MTQRLTPLSSSNRLESIDVLRGFAIFGILVVNVLYFFHPWYAIHMGPGSSMADHLAYFLTNTFFVSKFFTLFSFLFGLGLFIQMSRAEEKGAPFLSVYLRRMLFLALFGLAHGFFLWIGDILLLYALLGAVTALFFRRRSPRTLLIWSVVLIALPILFIALSTAAIQAARLSLPDMTDIEASFADVRAQWAQFNQEAHRVYTSAGWLEVTAHRADSFLTILQTSGLYMVPSILGMFLIGLRAGKLGWFRLPSSASGEMANPGQGVDSSRRFRKMLIATLPAGLALNLFVGLSGFELNSLGMEVLTWFDLAHVAALGIGSVLLCLSYMAGIVLLLQTHRGSRILTPLAPVGRMALSNYILHSVVMTTLAYGYGLGLFGRLPIWAGFLFAVLLFALQIPLSGWWFTRYRFGPLEYLWRTATYGKLAHIRKHTNTDKGSAALPS